MPVKQKTILFIIKAVVSFFLLAFILFQMEWNEVVKNLDRINYLFHAAGFLLNIVERGLQTYKCNLLLWARGLSISFGRLFLINAIGTFSFELTPEVYD